PLLAPRRAFGERTVRGEASKARARSRPARRAVVRVAGAEHEVAAVVRVLRGRAVKLDVVDLRAIAPGDAIAREGPAHRAAEPRQLVDLRDVELAIVGVHEEKPVAAPGDVSGHGSESVHV